MGMFSKITEAIIFSLSLCIPMHSMCYLCGVSHSGDKLAKNIKGIKPIVVLENALKIIGKYDINQHIQADKKETKTKDTQPTIVISQSYV
ncbi:FIG003033: Helicase domain protein [uncultured Candidatus Thioglobus sp.]|nr:FIG003033: Helicase domain protein [uncultured Candidatus Thioglobus sp.]